MGTPIGYIELKFGPRWKYISSARAFIQNFLAISIDDRMKADKVAMAASELLENAVKYASGEETQIIVTVSPETGLIKVTVENEASESARAKLKEVFNRISQGNPLEAYVSQMKEAALRSDGQSQLGLARIRYETGAAMTLDETEDENKVRVSLVVK